MPLKDDLERLVSQSASIGEQSLKTEEGTKQALVLPFVQALGYNVFNTDEVTPEYTADVGARQGWKVDYAIMRGPEDPIILIECKKESESLVPHQAQLGRYFPHVKARIGILTNGWVWQFFSDLDEPNKMDATPFLEIDIRVLKNRDFTELERFTKHSFDLDTIHSAATDMRQVSSVKEYLKQMYLQPDNDFVRCVALACNYPREGNLTQIKIAEFSEYVKRAFHGFVAEQINDAWQSVMERHNAVEGNDLPTDETDLTGGSAGVETNRRGGSIITTAEEQEAYELVKAAISNVVTPERVTINDTVYYCGVILDGDSRKTVCRFRFGPRVKNLCLGDMRNETLHRLDSITDISNYADQLRSAAERYLQE